MPDRIEAQVQDLGGRIPDVSKWADIIRAVQGPLGLLALFLLVNLSVLIILATRPDPHAGLIIFALIAVAGAITTVAVFFIRHTGPVSQRPWGNNSLQSSHPILEISTTSVDGVRGVPLISEISQLGKMFFGKVPDAPEELFVGQRSVDLFRELEGFVNPPLGPWDDLTKDQVRVHREFLTGGVAKARIPVRFNRSHPHFPEKSFIPLIVQTREEQFGQNTKREFSKIMYLDIEKLPAHILHEQVWNHVWNQIDLPLLASQLRTISQSIPADESANEEQTRKDTLLKAADLLEQSPSAEVVDLCAWVGFFFLHESAIKYQLHEIIKFLDIVDIGHPVSDEHS